MIACSVTSHPSRSKTDGITPENNTQQTENKNTAGDIKAQPAGENKKDTTQHTPANGEEITAKPSLSTADTLSPGSIDTLSIAMPADTTASDTVQNDSVSAPEPMFTNVISYKAADSVSFAVIDKKMLLHKNTQVTYEQTELTADFTELDMQSNTAYASGLPDSAGLMTGKPKFKDGGTEFESLDLKYNFKTGKAFVKEVVMQQGDGYIQGKLTKRMSESVFCVKDGWYTTCDQHDHPHFYVRMSKAKMIKDKKVVSGFANLVLEGVPLPLFIPFGFFPITKKGTSGILMPTYGEEKMRGFNLRDGGYYWHVSDYIDLAVTGTIYTNGSWGIGLQSNYRKRYKYNGNFSFNSSKNFYSEKNLPDYSESSDWALRWTHSQDAKANPYTTFSASVDLSSANNNYYNATNINDIANQRKQSSISWSKKWPDSPFSLTAGFTHNQNSRDSSISLSLPNMNLRMSQIYPLRKKERAGKLKWYENIGFSYNAELKNSIQTKESELLNSFKNMAKDWQNGFKHSIPLSTSFNLIKDVSLSPSFTYNGVAYLSSIRKSDWVTDSSHVNGGYIPIDTVYGLHYAHNYNASISLSYNPTIYGMFQFKNPNSKVAAIRHVIRPSASASYTPKIGVPRSKYWKTYTDANGNDQEYSIFDNKIYSTPTGAEESGSMRFSLDNNLEMKVRNEKDTTGKEEFKKIKLLESLQASASYDIFADSMNWSTIQLSARTKVFNGKVNINLSGTLDPYAINANAQRYNKYSGGIGRLTRVSASSGIQFSSDNGKNKEKKDDALNGNYNQYMDFDVPWSINLDYTFSYSKNYTRNTEAGATKPLSNNTISQMVRVSGDFSLTQKWKLGYSTGYDFQNKEITATSFNISRDLHCWEMTFSCIPFGTHQSYNFQINVRSSLLQDLKLTKRDSWYDNRR